MTNALTELQAWRIANDLHRAQQRAAFEAKYQQMLADNPGFAAAIPALEELAGVYAVAVSA
jgi:predicted metalloprotease with PDZ domain